MCMAVFAQFCFILFNMYQQYHAYLVSYPSLHAGYIVSVRRMVTDNIVLV